MKAHYRSKDQSRRGSAVALTAVSMTMISGFAALAIDVGMLYNVRAEMQRTADASALAGASKLLDRDRLAGNPNMSAEIALASTEAANYAASNRIQNLSPSLLSSDVVIGYLADPQSRIESINVHLPDLANTCQVRVRRDSSANGPVTLLFARIFGLESADISVQAAATYKDGVTGYKVTPKTGNADLLPLALHVDAWNNLMAHIGSSSDRYTYNETTGSVQQGADGIFELNLYPGSGTGQLPPGNFGTVDIGSPNNSTADLSRQIRYGVNAEDLSYFGGELRLGADGTLQLNGDTGLSAGIKDDLAAIKGLPRAIPLFNRVTGNGNNSMFTIVGFAGIRIMNVKLTAAMSSKEVIIQPAFVVDDTALTLPGPGPSYFVYQPVQLVR